MTQPQTAILPEAGPFALFSLLKVKQNPAHVLAQLKALPAL
ncbi:MAG: deferrochelatase, partial [Vibrio sp.]|nr:deferrochelatase [Vibrio sp.]